MCDVSQNQLADQQYVSPKFDLSSILSLSHNNSQCQNQDDQLIFKLISPPLDPEQTEFNEIIDRLLLAFSNGNLSMSSKANSKKKNKLFAELTYQCEEQNQIRYSFSYRDSCLISGSQLKLSSTFKLDLTRTSVISIVIQEGDDSVVDTIVNMLELSLPQQANLSFILFIACRYTPDTDFIEAKFTKLLRSGKLKKIQAVPLLMLQSATGYKHLIKKDKAHRLIRKQLGNKLDDILMEASLIRPEKSLVFKKMDLGRIFNKLASNYIQFLESALHYNSPLTFERVFLQKVGQDIEFQNPFQAMQYILQTLKPVIDQLNKLSNLSAQQIYQHGHTELKLEDCNDIFSISTLPQSYSLDENQLQEKHFSFVLYKSLFVGKTLKEVRALVQHVESISESRIWEQKSSIFKGAIFVGVFMTELKSKSKDRKIYLVKPEPQIQPVPLYLSNDSSLSNSKEVDLLMTAQLQKTFKLDFKAKPKPKLVPIQSKEKKSQLQNSQKSKIIQKREEKQSKKKSVGMLIKQKVNSVSDLLSEKAKDIQNQALQKRLERMAYESEGPQAEESQGKSLEEADKEIEDFMEKIGGKKSQKKSQTCAVSKRKKRGQTKEEPIDYANSILKMLN